MVIVHLNGGLGNQINQYGVGRLIAHKLNVELKIIPPKSPETKYGKFIAGYRLGDFNVQENFATSEEVKQAKAEGVNLNSRADFQKLISNLKYVKSDVFVEGHWLHDPQLYNDIADIMQKEFTRKTPWNKNAAMWRDKILSAECPVSMHFRLGDYLYDPGVRAKSKAWALILPLDYYYTCIDILKQKYNNLTVFVFSSNLQWCKENVRLDVPTEFVEGCETDNEEFTLITLCKHNIASSGTFGLTSAFINPNPDKKVFYCRASNNEQVKKWCNLLTPERKISLLNSGEWSSPNNFLGTWIRVPFDLNNEPKITQPPFFSLLLVVNNDAETISETLDSVLNQDYEYYEIIIIDNASTDGSGKICQQAIAGRENVAFKKLWTKVKNAEAWNMALNMTRGGGYYIFFLKGNDRFLTSALTTLYGASAWNQPDFIPNFVWLAENESGVAKYFRQADAQFQNENRTGIRSNKGQEAVRFLLNQQINRFLGTKLYNRAFLLDNGIKFNESLADEEAELFFQIECFLKSKYFMYVQNACYIAPKSSLGKYPVAKFHDINNDDAQVISKFKAYFTAKLDIYLSPKTAGGDFQFLYMSDDKGTVYKGGWAKEGDFVYAISSYVGKLKFGVKATVAGKILLALLGLYLSDPVDDTKRIPCWIDYTKLIVNRKVIFDNIIPARARDKAYHYYMDVKAGEEVIIEVEWLPHRSDT